MPFGHDQERGTYCAPDDRGGGSSLLSYFIQQATMVAISLEMRSFNAALIVQLS